ncbi:MULTISPECIES: FAD-dependent oxidoreductase [Tenebrionibacter/Tenebrionicola group]|jgi:glutamate synthase small subunit-like protein|uniref:FAD-dependent oxidoreductase n=2 Tax=Tenebrionibacter/Tenebrionicola group TaxID=2969848 RepID=A0A8K0V064_9ENTR|nr:MULTISPECIES: FAD-dependent oxidoreductase [Tenebrionibacter/Tenebrionicola group]MBK4714819.1 FAD-dependent oxidoreductase [Tenebrionibacter intestinalis]MBV4414058.1 FAD-dependent oxidoreductase [Tenebrionicola larvae]MBV5095622.1 FAD-dependent oxidoreductase [Tenebrionicola larvae]
MNKFIVANAQECINCHVCEVACAVAHHHEQWPEKTAFYPRIRVLTQQGKSVALTCRHCNDAPCVTSCPVAALTLTQDAVKLDEALCIGCKNCVLACPFGAIEMVAPEGEENALAQKCDLCADSAAGQPACVAGCPTQALTLMDGAGLRALRQQRQRATASGRYDAGRTPLRSARLLARAARKGATKVPAEARKTHFGEIYQGLDAQQAAFESERCLYCASKAWCNWTCPLHNAIPDFVRLVSEGRVQEAAELCNSSSSLPEICGRVCPQDRLCEGACTLKDRSGAVSIGNLERYITDTALEQGWRPDLSGVTPRRERVAVVGAGPAGLGCADILARHGVQVDVFDSHPEIGGLLTFGIPPFKLDKQVLSQRRDIFSAMGINFHLSCEVGRDIGFDALLAGYDAVFLGVGTYGLMHAGLEHEDAPGVVQALPFLIASTRRVMGLEDDARYPWIDVAGKNVVVLGGGDTAMDCVRTSVRRGAASVTCAYRRDEASMPGSKKEVVNAREEGVEFAFNVQPQFIERNRKGHVTGIGMVRTRMGEPGADGRRRPQIIEGSEFILAADVLIMAFGFKPHPMPWLRQHGVSFDDWGLIETGAHGISTRTSNPKVYAGGDAVHGADLVVTAMAAGRQAAREMIAQFDVAQASGG